MRSTTTSDATFALSIIALCLFALWLGAYMALEGMKSSSVGLSALEEGSR